MAGNILQTALAEEIQLLRELETIPTYQKLQAVRSVIAIYRAHESNKPGAEPSKTSERVISRDGSKASVVISAAVDFFERSGHRLQAPALLEEMKKLGIAVGGKTPVSALASILSHSALFDNVRGEGYGLAKWSNSTARTANADNLEPNAEPTVRLPPPPLSGNVPTVGACVLINGTTA